MNQKDQEEQKEAIPAWKSWEECLSYCREQKDNFYSWAFLAEAWNGHVTNAIATEYAEKKSGSRQCQIGAGWKAWEAIYGDIDSKQWPDMLESFNRYANCDTPEAKVFESMLSLAETEDKFGDRVFDEAALERNLSEGRGWDGAKDIFRAVLQRYSEWLEAILHYRVHRHFARVSLLRQDTAERRELVNTGLIQAAFGRLNQHGRDWWEFRHAEQAGKFSGTPDWRLVGKAQALEEFGELKNPEVDELAILFWPLLVRYRWTDRDLMSVIRKSVPRPDAYPLREDREFADYRKKALGLARTGGERAKSASDGRPRGWKVAMTMVGKPVTDDFPNK